ncbi:MAG TPA: RDD family protein [Thiobacillaceae bacterium]|nr:RDD family protein [Thiobacillaceae bacterium]
MNAPFPAAPNLASLRRRLASLVYECFLLAALFMVVGFLVVGWLDPTASAGQRLAFQLYLLLCAGLYFILTWHRGGQTLAMKTWRIRLVDGQGGCPALGRCVLRYVLAVAGLVAGGLGFLWALWDPQRQFLHDRLAGTLLVRSDALRAPEGDEGAQGEQT